MTTVAVIDYGMGNIRSVSKALEYAGGDAQVQVTYDPERILHADHVVFPGVGALRDCMSELQRLELDDVIRECARTRPFLGICLGMQALLDASEENGGTPGLGIIPGQTLLFPGGETAPGAERLKIPHMGWDRVHQVRAHALWEGIDQDCYFYFVHSYYVAPRERAVVAATTDYGVSFAAALARGNIFAVQFHPEKSQQAGLKLLANFLAWDGGA
ncbi:MAG: imidazole glycerol phosphate synthase subunit HisH [Gammaproteobacteria bacterium]|nr:imidazole glycerol phosphate synthase subunit HisH [Gammaproteobacteria bacterium]